MTAARPLPTVVGPTEDALRALLVLTLGGTALDGYEPWVAMNQLTASPCPRPAAGARLAAALHVPAAAAAAVLDRLVVAGLLADAADGLRVTRDGATVLDACRVRVGTTTARLTAGLDEAEVETTRRVLDVVRHRAEAELASAGRRPPRSGPSVVTTVSPGR